MSGKRTSGLNCANIGAHYTADELEFMLAMERWKRTNRKQFPTCSDTLEVLRSLGYVKECGGRTCDQ